MSKTLKYLLLSSLLVFSGAATAQQSTINATKSKTYIQEKKDTLSVPLWQGFMVEFDVEPLIENVILNNSTYTAYTYQGNIQGNLKNAYFPVVELGLGGASKSLANNHSYQGDGMYGKLGVDFNLLKPKPGTKINKNYFLAGVRLGASHLNYTIDNLTIANDYWGGTEDINYSRATTKVWFEVVAGVRVSFFKNIYLGWSVRNKHLLNQGKYGSPKPWYIPGYGIGNSSAWGFSYVVGYHF